MKRCAAMFLLCLLFNPINATAWGQSPGDFRSHQSGNWSDVNSWESYGDSAWIPASAIPTTADGAITIQGGHTILVDADVSVDQVTVNPTATLAVLATKTLTVTDGADSIDITVSGVLNNFGAVTLLGSARLAYESGGFYIHSVPGGGTTMPSATWRTGSTCRVDSSTGSTPSNLNTQNLYNLIWNAANQSANGGPNFADGAVIAGSLTVSNTKTVGTQFRLVNLSGGQTKNLYIRGNVNINGATAILTSTGSSADTLAKAVINIDGNVNLSAGQWSLVNSGAAYAEWKIKGNINITGGTMQSGTSGWYGRRTVNFNGGGSQSFTLTGTGTIGSAMTFFKVSNGSTVTVNFPWTPSSGSAINLESGKFVTSATNLLTIPATGQIFGGNSSSYIDGPLAHTIASTSQAAKMYPIGKGGAYRPLILTVNQDAATATVYTAEMFNATPPSRALPSALKSVSTNRYYNISKGAGANLSPILGATIQFSYDTDDSVSAPALLRIAKDSMSTNWLNVGGSGTAPNAGTITSNTFYAFSNFALATADTGTPVIVPTVSTTAASRISTTFATSGGNVSNDGGGAVSERGVCWNTTGSPTAGDSKTIDGSGNGVYSSLLTGLTPGQLYYVRAYATNVAGTGYGNETTVTTLSSIIPPAVTTASISNIQVIAATGGGIITNWGGDSVTARGVCWGTTSNPTITGSHTVDGAGLGSYVSGLYPLTGSTAYYVRAYATNSGGTGYGNEVSFTTQSPQADTTLVVAQDGSGNYLTVQAAFRAVPIGYTGKWTIFVKKGVYYEKDTLASGKNNVTLLGEDRDSTIITYDDYADRHGSGNPGTSGSFTIAIDASDFTAKDITFRNTYSPQPGVTGTQAVALRTQGDRHEYVNCKILGYQDTYYTWGGSGTGRMYHKNCFIEGTVDFIFGRNIVVFDSCTIHEIRNGSTITAGSTDASSLYGYVFRNCTIVSDSIGYDGTPITSFLLGRPWQGSPRTVFINTLEPWNLNAAGWQAWNVAPALYGELNCYGPGAGTGGRAGWSSQLTPSAATSYSLSHIFAKNSAASNLILYDWMPANAMTDQPLALRITASAGENGSTTPAGITNIVYGGSQSYAISAAPGYHIVDVLVDGVSVGAATTYNLAGVVANRTISATFEANQFNQYNLALNSTTGGTAIKDPDSSAYYSGTIVHLIAAPSAGYHFVNWTGDLTGTHNPDSVTMDGNKTITSNFARGEYVIIATAGPNGQISPRDSVWVDHGADAGFSITPDVNFRVDTLYVDGVHVDSTTHYTFNNVTGDHTIHAVFAASQYALDLSIVGNGTVTKIPDQSLYDYGSGVTLVAHPATAYKFSAWSGDASGTSDTALVLINGAKHVTATFGVDSAYLKPYRTFTVGSITSAVDDKGKTGKLVKLKADKVFFSFDLPNAPQHVPVLLKLSVASSGVAFVQHDTSWTLVDTVATFTASKTATTAAIDSGKVVRVVGIGAKGSAVKVSYVWSTTPKATKGTVTSFTNMRLGLPMPNEVNGLAQVYAGLGTSGITVGVPRADLPKLYGWFQAVKYGDFYKSLNDGKAKQTGAAHPFDTYATGKPVVKLNKSLPPTKYNSRLFGNLAVLKFNILASDAGVLPAGLGDLKFNGGAIAYDDTGNVAYRPGYSLDYNGKTLREICALADTDMMGQQLPTDTVKGKPVYTHFFKSSAYFTAMDSILNMIDSAFVGPVDTTAFASTLTFSGVRPLLGVGFLVANPSAVSPKVTPLATVAPETPVSYQLYQNYPNPFNPTTTIQFDLPQQSMVTLKVYNILGQEVASLIDRQMLEDGQQGVQFDASRLASGVYFYRLMVDGMQNEDGTTANSFQMVKKMLLVK